MRGHMRKKKRRNIAWVSEVGLMGMWRSDEPDRCIMVEVILPWEGGE